MTTTKSPPHLTSGGLTDSSTDSRRMSRIEQDFAGVARCETLIQVWATLGPSARTHETPVSAQDRATTFRLGRPHRGVNCGQFQRQGSTFVAPGLASVRLGPQTRTCDAHVF